MSDGSLELTFAGEPSLEDAARVRDALGQWNVRVTGFADYAPANHFVRDASGAIRGGVLAYVWGGCLHVDVLWLEDEFRGEGWGAKLVRAAEEAGREKGASAAYLDSFDWQARPFYEKLGYEVVAEVEGVPAGHKRFYMRKQLR